MQVEVGKIYKGTVTRIESYGAFIDVLPGKSGMCHISKISYDRISEPRPNVRKIYTFY